MGDGTPRRRTDGRDRKVSGTTPIVRGAADDGASVDALDFEDVGPTTIEPFFDDADVVSGERLAEPDATARSFEPPAPGEVVGGRYRLGPVLGRGAAGIVYAATHEAIGKRVALKVLYPHVATRPDAVQRFFREAFIAASVDHPNVVQVFDGGRDGELCFLAMELVDGEPLTAHLARGPHPVVETVQLFLRITHGVAAVHAAGVVHRDLKPDNVLLAGPERTPKVLDFGISKLATGAPKMTSLGAVMGTPFYMAPEQITDTGSVDARADVYSLGVMLYEALTGRRPYDGESVLEIFRHVSEGRCPPAHAHNPEVPPALSALVARALCPDREARYPDVPALREALAAISFDGVDAGLDFADRSEPWMLAGDAGDAFAPIESAPTRIAPPPDASGTRPAVSKASALAQAGRRPVPKAAWALLAASAITVGGGAATAILWWLLG